VRPAPIHVTTVAHRLKGPDRVLASTPTRASRPSGRRKDRRSRTGERPPKRWSSSTRSHHSPWSRHARAAMLDRRGTARRLPPALRPRSGCGLGMWTWFSRVQGAPHQRCSNPMGGLGRCHPSTTTPTPNETRQPPTTGRSCAPSTYRPRTRGRFGTPYGHETSTGDEQISVNPANAALRISRSTALTAAHHPRIRGFGVRSPGGPPSELRKHPTVIPADRTCARCVSSVCPGCSPVSTQVRAMASRERAASRTSAAMASAAARCTSGRTLV
jgi:hypothetical protein